MAKSIVDYLARWLAVKFLDTASAKKYHTEELVERSHRNGDLKASDIVKIYGMKHHDQEVYAQSTAPKAVETSLPVKVLTTDTQKVEKKEQVPQENVNYEQMQKDQIKQAMAQNNEDAPLCHQCGAVMVRNGSCYKCIECGTTSGCS